jgi:hypothetical protein
MAVHRSPSRCLAIRTAGLSAPVAAEHNRLHYPQILCFQEIDAVLEFITRAFSGIEFKKKRLVYNRYTHAQLFPINAKGNGAAC